MTGWHHHPGTRSGEQLTTGERAADRMRNGMGSSPFVQLAQHDFDTNTRAATRIDELHLRLHAMAEENRSLLARQRLLLEHLVQDGRSRSD